MEADTLYRDFAGRAVPNAGSRLLLRAEDAIDLVNASAEAGVPVVEVDAFKLDEDVSPDDVGDFSAAVCEGHGCWTDAETFIRDHADRGLAFEITLGDDPINAA